MLVLRTNVSHQMILFYWQTMSCQHYEFWAKAMTQGSQPILSLILIDSGFSNKGLYLHKTASKPMIKSAWQVILNFLAHYPCL